MSRTLRPILVAAALAAGALRGGLEAQVPDSVRDTMAAPAAPAAGPERTVRQDSARQLPVSPGGAFLRSVILPGWGQAKYEAYFRGSVYFAGWAANWFMNFRNFYRLDNARARLDIRTDQLVDELLAASGNPDSMRAVIDSFPALVDSAVVQDSLGSELRNLVSSRVQQREDWIAWSLFWLLASGVDAYVTGHLADFPAEVEIDPNQDRSVSLRVRVPVPGRRGAERSKAVAPPLPPGRAPPDDGT